MRKPTRGPNSFGKAVPRKRNEVIMSPLLILSTIAISAALVFYTWGVFGERRSGTLTRKYVTLFWIGLACDTTGTLMMSSMAAQIGRAHV